MIDIKLDIGVDTDGIVSAASNLKTLNNEMQSDFERLENSAKKIESCWKSPAGNIAVTKMYELFKFGESRYSVLQNYANFLEQQVDPNYNSAEETNKSLADQFK